MSHVFQRVVCGVDPSEAGDTAARLAARVALAEGSLTLVCVDDFVLPVHAGWQAATVAEQLESVRAVPAHAVATRLLVGDPLRCLLAEIERCDATLAVVGTHELSRAVGIARGSVATHLLHEAPCSVLVARESDDAERWPRSIVVGVDGLKESAVAYTVARELSERFDASLRAVAAMGETHVDLEAAHRIAPELEELHGRALHELHVLSEHADVVVVGSRQLRGIRALGSISERVAHEALSSVLVVRSGNRDEEEDTR